MVEPPVSGIDGTISLPFVPGKHHDVPELPSQYVLQRFGFIAVCFAKLINYSGNRECIDAKRRRA